MIIAPTPVPVNTRALVLQSPCPLIENENVPRKASFRHAEGQKMVEGPGALCPTKGSSSLPQRTGSFQTFTFSVLESFSAALFHH